MRFWVPLFLLAFLFLVPAAVLAKSGSGLRPDEGRTTRATTLQAEPRSDSRALAQLPAGQSFEIEAISEGGTWFYVEIDRPGPDLRGWVLAAHVQVTEYDD